MRWEPWEGSEQRRDRICGSKGRGRDTDEETAVAGPGGGHGDEEEVDSSGHKVKSAPLELVMDQILG